MPCIFCTYCNTVTDGCSCLFCVFISFIFTLHVSGSHKPIIRCISSCFLYTTIWFIWCLCCSSACACGLVCRGGFTVGKNKGNNCHILLTVISTGVSLRCLANRIILSRDLIYGNCSSLRELILYMSFNPTTFKEQDDETL